jgi:hypothetical protein
MSYAKKSRWNHYQRRFMRANVTTLLLFFFGGCALNPGYAGHMLHIYKPFDNSRAGGPSYLIGPPDHHLEDEARIDRGMQ